MSDDLPDGWAESELGHVADLVLGKMLDGGKVASGASRRYLRNVNVQWNRIDTEDVFSMPFAEHESERYGLRAGDLLVCEGGEPGRCAVWDGREPDMRFQKALHRVRPSSILNVDFLRHHLRWDAGRGALDESFTGSTIKHLTGRALAKHRVRLPPPAEQTRIVEKVDALLDDVNKARDRLAKVPRILKRFRQSVLAAACSGRLTDVWRRGRTAQNADDLIEALRSADPSGRRAIQLRTDLELFELPDGWTWVDLRFLVSPGEAFCYGVVQPGDDPPDGVRLVRSGDLHDLRAALPGLRRIPASVDERHARSRLLGGEILVTVVGANIGTVELAPAEAAGCNIARAVAKVPVREVVAEYVAMWLRSTTAFAWMVGDAREVARPTLNLEQLATLPVPLPPFDEQAEIVRRVEPLLRLADAIEQRGFRARELAERLPQAILAKAFSGQLVPTEAELARAEGRDYEHASELLARITSKSATSAPARRGRRKGKAG